MCSRWKWPIFDSFMSLNVMFGSFVCDQWWHQEPCYNAVSEALLTFSPSWWNANPLQPQSEWCPMYITKKTNLLCWEMIPSLEFSVQLGRWVAVLGDDWHCFILFKKSALYHLYHCFIPFKKSELVPSHLVVDEGCRDVQSLCGHGVF